MKRPHAHAPDSDGAGRRRHSSRWRRAGARRPCPGPLDVQSLLNGRPDPIAPPFETAVPSSAGRPVDPTTWLLDDIVAIAATSDKPFTDASPPPPPPEGSTEWARPDAPIAVTSSVRSFRLAPIRVRSFALARSAQAVVAAALLPVLVLSAGAMVLYARSNTPSFLHLAGRPHAAHRAHSAGPRTVAGPVKIPVIIRPDADVRRRPARRAVSTHKLHTRTVVLASRTGSAPATGSLPSGSTGKAPGSKHPPSPPRTQHPGGTGKTQPGAGGSTSPGHHGRGHGHDKRHHRHDDGNGEGDDGQGDNSQGQNGNGTYLT